MLTFLLGTSRWSLNPQCQPVDRGGRMEVVSCHLPNVGADSTFSGTSLGAGAIAPCVALGFTVVGLVLGFKSKAWNKFLLPQVGGISILHSLELREGSCGQLFPSCLCLAGCLVSWLVGWLVLRCWGCCYTLSPSLTPFGPTLEARFHSRASESLRLAKAVTVLHPT
jgi:hypothetical protein